MANKIGFRHYDDKSTQNVDQSTDSVENKPIVVLTHKELFRQFIESKYKPFGDISAKVFKDSRELAYEARDHCEPSLIDIAMVMKELGYKSDSFLNYFPWVLYDKEPLVY